MKTQGDTLPASIALPHRAHSNFKRPGCANGKSGVVLFWSAMHQQMHPTVDSRVWLFTSKLPSTRLPPSPTRSAFHSLSIPPPALSFLLFTFPIPPLAPSLPPTSANPLNHLPCRRPCPAHTPAPLAPSLPLLVYRSAPCASVLLPSRSS